MMQTARTSSSEPAYVQIGSEEECQVPPNDNKMMRGCRLCCVLSAGLFGIIFLICGILMAVLFDNYVSKIIDKELVIGNGSDAFKTWADPPIIPYLKLYFFNVTNIDEVLNNGKPNLVEVGPYTYREHWKKINITFHDNGTVTYQTRKWYFFDPELSVGDESDIIHTLNVPLIVACDRLKDMPVLIQLLMSSFFAVHNSSAFVHRNVSDLVWGYYDPLIPFGNKFLPDDKKVPFDSFGFFYNKNGSSDGMVNIYTGSEGLANYTLINTFDYSRYLNYWKRSSACNEINGTDGTSYPPNVSKNSTIYLFNKDLCRSLPLKFNNTVHRYGIEGYRFTPPRDVFANSSVNPDNECFCVDGPCIGGGVFSISPCKYDSPTILSWPHFYEADRRFVNAVRGLKPDQEKHALYIDLIPRTGSPLAAEARLQINFKTTKLVHIAVIKDISELVFPVVWFEDGVASLPDKVIALLRLSTVVPKEIKFGSLLLFFILGGVLTVLSLVLLIFWTRNSSSKLAITTVDPAPRSTGTTYESEEKKGHVNPAMSPYNPDA